MIKKVTFILLMLQFPGIELQAQNDLKLALDFFNRGNVSQSLLILDSAIAKNHKPAEALYLRAYINLAEGNKENALRDYDLLLKVEPRHRGALTNRSLLLMEGEHYESALEDLNILVEDDPDDWRILYERGYCYGLMGKHKKAVEDFSRVIRLNPNNAEAYAQRGVSKINELSNEGLIRPAPEQCEDACLDLKKAREMGDTTVVKMMSLYCK
jgi:tetratricopeptide (TPR) repeat protein